MSAHSHEVHDHVPEPPVPVAFETLCTELSRTAQFYLQQIGSVIDQIAPAPGRIVYLHTTNLGRRLNGLEPVVFSAIDAATHIQVAQINFARTSAAAFSFVDFAVRSFPFPVTEIKTRKESPFGNQHNHRPHRNFGTLIGERGLLHSFVNHPPSDVLFSITSKQVFGYVGDTLRCPDSTLELQNSLHQFLFFHNNFRFIPWLDGKTPIQKLRTFERYQSIHSFSLHDEPESGHASVAGRSLATQACRSTAAINPHADYTRTIMNGEEHETDSCHRR